MTNPSLRNFTAKRELIKKMIEKFDLSTSEMLIIIKGKVLIIK